MPQALWIGGHTEKLFIPQKYTHYCGIMSYASAYTIQTIMWFPDSGLSHHRPDPVKPQARYLQTILRIKAFCTKCYNTGTHEHMGLGKSFLPPWRCQQNNFLALRTQGGEDEAIKA